MQEAEMTAQQPDIDYARIETAISFIVRHLHDQPSLEDIAAKVHVSPFHFQRMFLKWAGVSPKKFMQFLSLSHAKAKLQQGASVLDAAYDSGLSGAGRLHDLFVTIDAMTPGTYKYGGAGLMIDYDYAATPFGRVIVASTPVGVCHMAFEPLADTALAALYQKFPNAKYQHARTAFQQQALDMFGQDWSCLRAVKLHLPASKFQIKVWEALLKIPMGVVASYGDIAQHIGQPSAARAVGTAIANNPVAFLIPCHRVIRKTGAVGGYMWGTARKQAMLGWETAHSDDEA
jgi:AraC family transcriptional regulator of adaptative response/methylated-DNA-[protein]-cysteine methyltransferase